MMIRVSTEVRVRNPMREEAEMQNEKQMKILVVDDNWTNLEAARAQLKDCDLAVAGSYEVAQEWLGGGRGYSVEKTNQHDFDIVLVDLLMPAGAQQQGPDGQRFVGQEMPIGIFLALLAAKNGAKFVAVFTDSDHHSHPASACFDSFNKSESDPTPMTVEGAKLLLCNTRNWVNYFRPENLAEKMEFNEWYNEQKPHVHAKDWRALLTYLTK